VTVLSSAGAASRQRDHLVVAAKIGPQDSRLVDCYTPRLAAHGQVDLRGQLGRRR
jgi:hypothetical protein